jgi:hypothetical protein
MGIGVVSQRFCCVCGTGHSDPATCPGELRATGAERPGWRVNVETPFGHEAIGVLLAPSYDQWRARIVTYPNALWSAPGGRGALKFVGSTREEAEAQAIAFVEEHVRAKRYLRRDGLAPVDVEDASNVSATSSRPLFVAVRRKTRCFPVRFGLDRAVSRGTTLNVSPEGMFVHVASPTDSGGSLLLHLELDGYTVPMRGLVMWIRRRAEAERPTGMGIRLSDPPPYYQSFVSALA